MQYTLIRSKRTTVALQIKPGGELVVRAPLKCPQSKIDEIIVHKQDWITRHLLKQEEHKPVHPRYQAGESFLFMGKPYKLIFDPELSDSIRLEGDLHISPRHAHEIKRIVQLWYHVQADALLPQRVAEYARLMHLTYKSVKLNNAKTRWGSCSTRGNLNFSRRLVMTPLPVIDYVVVHELSHLTHPNHSPAFWTLVAQYCPEYKQHRKWLRLHGHELIF